MYRMYKVESHAVVWSAWWIIIDSRCFVCNRCDSATQQVDLAEALAVDEETFGCVNILRYQEDTLGGVDLATTAYNQKWMDEFQRAYAISDI